MNTISVDRPARFFGLTFLLTWIPWSVAALFSYQKGQTTIVALFELLGVLGPFFTALIMTRLSNNNELKQDYRDRLLNFRRIGPAYLPAIFLLVPFSLLVATFISVLLGKSSAQYAFSAGLVNSLIVIIVAPFFEELGWRGYGMDSLRS